VDLPFGVLWPKYPKEHAELTHCIKGDLPEGWEKSLPVYKPSDPTIASHKLSDISLTAVSPVLPDLLRRLGRCECFISFRRILAKT